MKVVSLARFFDASLVDPARLALMKGLGFDAPPPWPRPEGPFPPCGACASRHHATAICPEVAPGEERADWALLGPWPEVGDEVELITRLYFAKLVRPENRWEDRWAYTGAAWA